MIQAMQIRVYRGPWEKEGLISAAAEPTSVPGIVMTPWRVEGEWRSFPVLTHAASGLLIGGPYRTPEEARLIAGALGGLLDWRQPVEAVRAAVEALRSDPDLKLWFRLAREPRPLGEPELETRNANRETSSRRPS